MERPYAVEERFLGLASPEEVGRGNAIPQAQGRIRCGASRYPEGAYRLEKEDDPELAHLTYWQTKQGDAVHEVYAGSAYALPRNGTKPPLMVEIGAGAGRGRLFQAVLAENPGSMVHSFEPTAALRQSLQSARSVLNVSNVVWGFGLADKNRTAHFRVWGAGHVAVGPLRSGLVALGGSEGGKWAGQVEAVELRDAEEALTAVVAQEGRGIDLLYLNCEGCEYEVIQRLAASRRLRHIPRIAVSWHAGGANWQLRCPLDMALRRSHGLANAAYSHEVWVRRVRATQPPRGQERRRYGQAGPPPPSGQNEPSQW